ncbi:uncharacterized protein [Halyomorpha halys]|uniref:uncharacterized protein n=1 Tax=Halyomorpha halys TaxID=286706 RepID=UPI0006D4DB43|nr:uncharacterized protein LOC106688375 [Halyomorpha halys]
MKGVSIFFATILSLIVPSLTFRYFDEEELKPCPKITPDSSVKIEMLTGRWQLSLLVLDAATEDIEESGACINGEVTVMNSTHMRQVWEMFTPYVENEPTATFELLTTSLRPGVWAVHTPLGGILSATVFDSNKNYILVCHCGWHRGAEVHLWTAGVTRGRLTPKVRMKLSKSLMKAGYHPSETKVITWSMC